MTSSLCSGISDQLDKRGVKQIKAILEMAKSSYVVPFKRLAKMIQDGSAQAQSNLKFLMLLKEPCTTLYNSSPTQVPNQLPEIIRVIWVNSQFFNTRS